MAEKLYRSHSLEKTSDGISGSLTIWEDTPHSPFDVGDSFYPVPNGPLLNVEKVNISDNVIGELNGKPLRQWQIVIEGSSSEKTATESEEESDEIYVKYTVNLSSEGKSGTMEVTQRGQSPSFGIAIGQKFSLPGIGSVICTDIKSSNNKDKNGVQYWTTIYEGSLLVNSSAESDEPDSSLPEDETAISYELNGVTVRTVAGEFLALRRSSNPITKKTITIYNSSVNSIANPGGSYEGGIVVSENVIKETMKVNGVKTSSYYKHTIEVES